MSLDVWIGRPTKTGRGLAVSFEPESYYWFLYSLFEEFAQSHGQMIDLYGGALFEPGELEPVLALVGRAETLVEAQGEQFDVHVETNLGSALEPRNEEIHGKVTRAEYLAFLRKLRAAVLEAQRLGKPLVFFGD